MTWTRSLRERVSSEDRSSPSRKMRRGCDSPSWPIRLARPSPPVSSWRRTARRSAADIPVAVGSGGGRGPVFQDRLGRGECVVDGLAAAGGQLRGVLAAGQQRRGPFGGGLFCLGCPRPGPEPGATEAVAYRGGGADEAGGEIRVAAVEGQRAERA